MSPVVYRGTTFEARGVASFILFFGVIADFGEIEFWELTRPLV